MIKTCLNLKTHHINQFKALLVKGKHHNQPHCKKVTKYSVKINFNLLPASPGHSTKGENVQETEDDLNYLLLKHAVTSLTVTDIETS